MSLVVQPSLFGSVETLGVAELGDAVERRPLSDGAWVDLRPGFITAADELFDALASAVPWREERMHMYDSTVRVPRLLARYPQGEALPHPVLEEARSALNAHYAEELGEPFVSLGLCLYRDGNDSVAWHGDRIARESPRDTMVAIVSLGAARPFGLRPKPGGPRSAAPTRPWGSAGDGRKLSANLAARHTEGRQLPGRADQHPVPPALGQRLGQAARLKPA